jgi:hypothetical protein
MAAKISEELRQQIRAAKEADPSLSGSQLGRMFGLHKSTCTEIVRDLATQFLPTPSPENGGRPVRSKQMGCRGQGRKW